MSITKSGISARVAPPPIASQRVRRELVLNRLEQGQETSWVDSILSGLALARQPVVSPSSRSRWQRSGQQLDKSEGGSTWQFAVNMLGFWPSWKMNGGQATGLQGALRSKVARAAESKTVEAAESKVGDAEEEKGEDYDEYDDFFWDYYDDDDEEEEEFYEGPWQHAISLLGAMQDRRLQLSEINIGSAIQACLAVRSSMDPRSSRWEQAFMLFRHATEKGILPDPACAGLVISECEQRGLRGCEEDVIQRLKGTEPEYTGETPVTATALAYELAARAAELAEGQEGGRR